MLVVVYSETLHITDAMKTVTAAVNPSPDIWMIDPPPVPPRVRFTAVTLGVRDLIRV